jgi:hypothetical protein
MQREASVPAAPAGYATVNPFIITREANGLIDFLKEVFGATERPGATVVTEPTAFFGDTFSRSRDPR